MTTVVNEAHERFLRYRRTMSQKESRILNAIIKKGEDDDSFFHPREWPLWTIRACVSPRLGNTQEYYLLAFLRWNGASETLSRFLVSIIDVEDGKAILDIDKKSQGEYQFAYTWGRLRITDEGLGPAWGHKMKVYDLIANEEVIPAQVTPTKKGKHFNNPNWAYWRR